MRLFFISVIVLLTVSVQAQSGRVGPANSNGSGTPVPGSDRTVKELFDDANNYSKTKFAEFEQKKVRFSDSLAARTKLEQKQLAAKYAALASERTANTAEDLYYLGLLHWIAENYDGTAENLRKYIDAATGDVAKTQTARSIVVVILAKRRQFEDAERLLSEYVKDARAGRVTERLRMESELAKAYLADKQYVKSDVHAVQAYQGAEALAADPATRARSADELLDAGMLMFESRKALNKQKEAEDALGALQTAAGKLNSPTLYFYAADHLIKYMIETGRKPLALETYASELVRATRELSVKSSQQQVIQRLKRREKHYRLLGEPAPALMAVDQWFPGTPKPLSEFRGKVVLLDFWATWCAPCLEAFPEILDWRREFGPEGFEVLGITRYYGAVSGGSPDNPSEINFLKTFKEKHALPYDFVVAKDESDHIRYGAATIPTTVLIDRKGVIRYLESGTNSTRLEEIRAMIATLIAER